MLYPERSFRRARTRATRAVWQGKVFPSEGEGDVAVNRFFGLPFIRGQVYAGQSWLDGRPSVILDYQQGVDHLSVDQWFADNQFSLIGSARFTGAGDEIRFQQINGGTVVFGDVDGDRQADFSVRIEGSVTLTTDDFVF